MSDTLAVTDQSSQMEMSEKQKELNAIVKELADKSPEQVAEMILTNRERIAHLEQLVETDEKTPLLNERGWINRTPVEFARAARYKEPVASFKIDLDKLKYINDNISYDDGDKYLKLFGSVMQTTYRKGDILSHRSGDEFYAQSVGMSKERAAAVAAELSKNMEDVINLTMPDDDFFPVIQAAAKDNIQLGASVGFQVKEWAADEKIPENRADFEEYVNYELSKNNKQADRNMQANKKARKVTRE